MNGLKLRVGEAGLQIVNDLLLDVHRVEAAADNVADGIGHHRRELTILLQPLTDALAHHRRVAGHNVVNRRYCQHLPGFRRRLGSTGHQQGCD